MTSAAFPSNKPAIASLPPCTNPSEACLQGTSRPGTSEWSVASDPTPQVDMDSGAGAGMTERPHLYHTGCNPDLWPLLPAAILRTRAGCPEKGAAPAARRRAIVVTVGEQSGPARQSAALL